MLTAHYRSPINFSDELLAGAKNGLERLKTVVAGLKHRLAESADYGQTGIWLEKKLRNAKLASFVKWTMTSIALTELLYCLI